MGIESERFVETVEYIKARVDTIPETAIILGSDLSLLSEQMDTKIEFDYSLVPHFLVPTDKEKSGKLFFGTLNYTPVLIMNGRFHYYEGYEVTDIIYPIRVLSKLGIKNVILVNEAGAINTDYMPGEFMVIRDHMNFSGISALRGKNLEEFGQRFPDMTEIYDRNLMAMAEKIACENGIVFNEGVYAYMPGPNYETPSEINALRILGADAVGMSIALEAVAAKHCGLNILGISNITNMAMGVIEDKFPEELIKAKKDFANDNFILWMKLLVRTIYMDSRGISGNFLGEGSY